jgi:hypothetical protein
LLDVAPEMTRPLHVSSGKPLIVSSPEGWEVRLTVGPDAAIDVHAFGAAAVRVNDVQVRSIARARVGDLISLPDRFLLVQQVSLPPVPRVAMVSHEAFEQRLVEEVNRSRLARTAVSLLVVRSHGLRGRGMDEFLATPEIRGLHRGARAVVVGQLAQGTLELLCPGASPADVDEVREQLSEALGRLGRPFRWGWASSPVDALTPMTLWGRTLDRLFGERIEPADELPHVDPVMVRLWSLCDIWAAAKGGVLMLGEVGSGRETLARAIHERSSPHAPYVVLKSAVFDSSSWPATVERARGGTLYLRHPDVLPPAELGSFWAATAFRPMAGARILDHRAVPVVVAVPALRDRPLDVVPITEHILSRLIGFDRSPKLMLTPAARLVLSKDWVGSVRELKTSLQRAALLVDASGEVLPEYLATARGRFVDHGSPQTDLRASLRVTERRSFLEMLELTNWNVTEAARALGLPRRTVVYRMSRLGLKRPTQPG